MKYEMCNVRNTWPGNNDIKISSVGGDMKCTHNLYWVRGCTVQTSSMGIGYSPLRSN